jgi:hypothetical protein
MAAPESSSVIVAIRLAGLSLLLGALGCGTAATPRTAALPPQSVSQGRPSETPATPAPAAAPAPAEKKPSSVVVIDAGDDAEAPAPTLVEAAKAEKQRRKSAAAPVAVIDNKTLADYAKGQKLTVGSQETATKEAGGEDADPAAEGVEKHDETWWRTQARDIRERWRDATDRVTDLEAKVADLRRRFYATDDPYVRDSQVKPAWDHAIEDLETARHEAEHGAQELQAFLDQGHLAGALPGWLREGIELEPTPPVPQKPPTADAGEPPIADSPPPTRRR